MRPTIPKRSGVIWSWVVRTIAISCVVAPWTAAAAAPPVDLAQLARAARSEFKAVPPERLVAAKHKLGAAIERLDAFLAEGTQDNAARWKKYLRWEQMRAALDGPDNETAAGLGPVAAEYFRNYAGLEMTAFTEVRDALVEYLGLIPIVRDPNLQGTYQKRIDQLADWLATYAEHPNGALRIRIGQAIGWLERAGQAPEVVAAIRRQYCHPNLYATISQRLAAAGVRGSVERTMEVVDCIMGTSIRGTANFAGTTNLQLIDSADSALLQLNMRGTILSDNSGTNRGVTILNHGTTSVDATKAIIVQAEGISTASALAHCCTTTQITGICAKSCLIEKLARKRVYRSKSKAESIASRHAEQRVAQQMDDQAVDIMTRARDTYQEKFRNLLLRRGQFPDQLSFRTKAQQLRVVWQQADAGQLGAPPAPKQDGESADLAVRLHESFVSNFSRAMLGGFTLTDERLAKILEDTGGEVPEEIKISPDKEPWSITFSSVEPVSVQFSNDTIRFAIRGRRFTSGNQKVETTIEMSAVYAFKKTAEGARLTRQGDVSVDYVGLSKLGAKEVAIRAVMRRKFEALFADEFITKGIKLPGRWQQGGTLQLKHLSAAKGWLAISWLAPQVDQIPLKPIQDLAQIH